MITLRLTTLTKKPLVMILFWVFAISLPAQDIHFSQFKNAPFLLSPALTGVFDGKTRIMGNYRAQWQTVPVSYRTFMAAADTKLYTSDNQTSFWGLGAVFSFDHAGDSKMGTTSLGLNGAYTHQVTKANFITFGIQLAGTQRSFKTDELFFDQQYNGERLDPTASTGEDFSDKSVFYGDFSAGVNWHYNKPDSRTNLSLGGGWFHINEPNASFWDEPDIILCNRVGGHFLGLFQAGKAFDILLHGVGKYQKPYTEYLIGTAGRIHINQTPTKNLAIDLGLSYRWNATGFSDGDALIPVLEVNYKDWLFGISYDINISDFKTASEGYGGPEFAIQYIFRPAPPVEFCPTCPVYMEP